MYFDIASPQRDTIEVRLRYLGHALFVILLCVLVACAVPVPGMAAPGHSVCKSLRTGRGVSLLQNDTVTIGIDLPDLGGAGLQATPAPPQSAYPVTLRTAESVPLCRVLRC